MTQKRKIIIIGRKEDSCEQLKQTLADTYIVGTQKNEDNNKSFVDNLVCCASREEISAVFLDVSFPYEEGMEMLKNLTRNGKILSIPIIVLTDCSNRATEIQALKLGATEYIKKPYNIEVLKQKLENIIKTREAFLGLSLLEKDPLTSLYNKQSFFEKVSDILQTCSGMFDIVCFDIERFKLINDFFGTEMGDLVLKYTAEVLENHVLEFKGICARLDSDIFVCLVPRMNDLEQNFIMKIAESVQGLSLGFNITIKFGIFKIEDPTIPVIAMCDRAMLAKQSIKGKYGEVCAFYDKSLREKLIEEQEITNDMSSGLVNGHFKVYYQPKYNLVTGGIIGAEALVRWIHPEKGMITPYRFIPLFEKNGFITTLDIYIWENVCSYIRDRINKGLNIVPISVNVSRVDIYNPNLVDILQKLIKKYEISHNLLELEITETAYTENPEQMINIIHKLKEKGFKISMDDFGSGYSSLNMLSEVAVDTIKLDMKFLQNTDNGKDEKSGNILNFVVNLAKWMSVPVIAEGIETQEQVEYLKSIGCFKGQGYYFSRPLAENGFSKLLNMSIFDRNKEDKVCAFKFVDINEIWNPCSHFNTIFNNYIGALAIFEYSNGRLLFLRANDEYYKVINTCRFNYNQASHDILKFLYYKDKPGFIENLNSLDQHHHIQSATRWWISEQKLIWLRENTKVIYKDANKSILLARVEDVTEQKGRENLLIAGNEGLKKLCAENEKELRDLKFAYNNIPCGIIQFVPKIKNNIINVNNECLKIFGYKTQKDFIKGCNGNLLQFLTKEDRKRVAGIIAEFLSSGEQKSFRIQVKTKNKDFVWVKGYVLKDFNNSQSDIYFFFTDDTYNYKEKQHLKMLKDQFIVYTKHSNSVVFRYNIKENLATFVTLDEKNKPKYLKIPRFPQMLLDSDILFPEYREEFKNFFEKIHAGAENDKVQIKALVGKAFSWYEISFFTNSNVYDKEVVCLIRDITEAKEQELLLLKQAKIDALTGLYNRTALQVHLTKTISNIVESGRILAFLMIDLDGFKEINDKYGHICGDQALIAVSDIFSKEIRDGDIVARIGGDEFVVVLENIIIREDVLDYASNICSSIERYKREFEFTLSCSIGISIAPDHGMEFQQLYEKADKALYKAKSLGKNTCYLYQ